VRNAPLKDDLTWTRCICNNFAVAQTGTGAELATRIVQTCLIQRARFVARKLSNDLDDNLRSLGINASQLGLLALVGYAGPIRRNEIGKMMRLEASTLTRNLRVMQTNGWIGEVHDASDRRGLPVRITSRGDALLAQTWPAWESAQQSALSVLGTEGRAVLMNFAPGP